VIRAGRYILTKAQVFDDTGKLDIVWFNQPYIRNSLKIGSRYLFEGKISTKKSFHSLSSPQFEYYDDGDDFLTDAAVALTIAHGLPGASQTADGADSSNVGKVASDHKSVHLGRVTPFYEATEGLSAKWIRSRINYLKRYVNELIVDPLSDEILAQNGLCSLSEAIYKLHFPENFDEILQARKRLGFDELLAMSLNVESARQQRRAINAFSITLPDEAKKKLLKNVSYKLTADQETALDEILTDMAKTEPMNRLLNGDVGSGKTILAILAAYATVLVGKNAIIMAPTTILAQQHFDTFKNSLHR
jgi:ATP-dependent DNA helicase RecG